MRSMLQLLGGVAVAGAVAAGTTAFTAAGLSATGLSAQNDAFLGGSVSPTVHGAALAALVIDQTADVSGTNKVSAIHLTFDANTPDGSPVTLTSNGAVTSGGTATGFWCTAVATGTHVSDCTVGVTGTHNNGDTWSGLSTVTINVT
jgi:hypothetical protein